MVKIENQKLLDMYTKMILRLNRDYPKRFYMYIPIFQKKIAKEIAEADDNISYIWGRCLYARSTLLEFIGALKKFEALMLQGFELYNNRRKT